MKIDDHRSHKSNQQCKRCGLLYPKDEEECIHCGNLDEAQLHALKQQILNSEETNSSIGKVFFILTIVVILVFAISYLV